MSTVTATIDYGVRGTVQVVPDAAALAAEAAERFVAAVAEAVSRRGVASVALSGGSTPKQMAALLATPAYRERVDWRRLHVFWGDERWVPLSSPESNAGEAKRALLDTVGIPADNVHPFRTEDISPEDAAAAYERDVKAVVPTEDGLPRFDLVFLGMGDDGHTASLFPGTAAIREAARLVVAHRVEKLDATRLTFTPPLLNAAREVIFLAAGSGKASRLAEVLDGPVNVDELPSQVIRPRGGALTWLVDETAAAALAKRPKP